MLSLLTLPPASFISEWDSARRPKKANKEAHDAASAAGDDDDDIFGSSSSSSITAEEPMDAHDTSEDASWRPAQCLADLASDDDRHGVREAFLRALAENSPEFADEDAEGHDGASNNMHKIRRAIVMHLAENSAFVRIEFQCKGLLDITSMETFGTHPLIAGQNPECHLAVLTGVLDAFVPFSPTEHLCRDTKMLIDAVRGISHVANVAYSECFH
jgi:hypothetical protein